MEIFYKRLLEIRQALGLKQGEFAKRLGIPQTTYSTIEVGKSPIKDRHIKLICLTFGVNEGWLRTGAGKMLNIPPVAENEDEKRLLELFRRLTIEMQAVVLKKIQELLAVDKERWDTPPSEAEKGDQEKDA